MELIFSFLWDSCTEWQEREVAFESRCYFNIRWNMSEMLVLVDSTVKPNECAKSGFVRCVIHMKIEIKAFNVGRLVSQWIVPFNVWISFEVENRNTWPLWKKSLAEWVEIFFSHDKNSDSATLFRKGNR